MSPTSLNTTSQERQTMCGQSHSALHGQSDPAPRGQPYLAPTGQSDTAPRRQSETTPPSMVGILRLATFTKTGQLPDDTLPLHNTASAFTNQRRGRTSWTPAYDSDDDIDTDTVE
ncbi:hypothetical protein OBBRIDRAFT_834123 [Obba rivulosa]|uniref:Uncharacterized protein n=1 Tax=Obba rivulosa TaxID=1052685 RepID=A0A8E2AWE1_9APHY|nr:hypothetical protein OBBRIDRAFT_834123 [Obba rivulosa]